MKVSLMALIGLGFVLGARHSIDWDHIAAISDFIGVEEDKRKGFKLSLSYVLGHETVNLLLGLLAVLIGHNLPNWIDGVMERVVGTTLLVLGLWLIIVLVQNRKAPVMISRWRLLFIAIKRLGHYLADKATGKPHSHRYDGAGDIGARGAYGIGFLHGIGGETATQILLFMTAAGAGTLAIGISAVFSFIIGLFLAQLLMIIILILGYAKIAKSPKIYNGIALLTAAYSLVIGIYFITGRSNSLPSLTAFLGHI